MAKFRQGFVTNSSSSSYVTAYIGDQVIFEGEDYFNIPIEDLLESIRIAVEKTGKMTLRIESEGSYEG